MRLTKSADFALRMLLYLAKTGEASTMPILAKELRIPYNNLIKLVQKLGRAGVLETKQGKSGGVYLAQLAHKTTFRQVVDIIDGPVKLSDCMHHSDACLLSGNCELKGALAHIQNQINGILEGVTIADIAKVPHKKGEVHAQVR